MAASKDEWSRLNKRQQTYMQAIYETDQAQEADERDRARRTYQSRPADEWRWMIYGDLAFTGSTPLKRLLLDAKLVDPGTGSTFKALEERKYILVKGSFDTLVHIRLTNKGRKLVREALNIKPERLPVGTLREWHWRALCRAYVRGDEGMHYDEDTGDGFGYVSWNTVRRLLDYKSHGEDKPLIGHRRLPDGRPYVVSRTTLFGEYIEPSCITEFGKHYYCENWQRYRELYPEVDAPEPQVEESRA